MILLAVGMGSYAQLITVLLVFVVVLGITAATTKWIANYQKQQSAGGNIEVIETSRISNTKYIQIIRVGETYIAIAVSKDAVTLLGEVSGDQLKLSGPDRNFSFKELLDKAVRKNADASEESREHDEQ